MISDQYSLVSFLVCLNKGVKLKNRINRLVNCKKSGALRMFYLAGPGESVPVGLTLGHS